MNIKKTKLLLPLFVLTLFFYANLALGSANYEPLVRIPGLPSTGTISLNQYLVGIYNFMLSVVGIVAVMMLIIGGMKYITSVGSATMASEAKETIKSAFAGLLLALLSWVIVSTINPDVLYIKQPGSKMIPVISQVCTTSANDANPCICKNGNSIPNPGGTNNCEDVCEYNCVPQKTTSCYLGSATPDGNGMCGCVDGTQVKAANPGTPCQTVCSVNVQAGDGKHHCLVADVRMAAFTSDEVARLSFSELRKKATMDGTRTNPFIFTDRKRCEGLMEGELSSIIFNKPAIYSWDSNWDGTYDYIGPTASYIATCFSYDLIAPTNPSACYHDITPKSYICPTKFKIEDSAGNESEDVLYFGWLEP